MAIFTPLDVARGLAKFIAGKMQEHDEHVTVIRDDGTKGIREFRVYAGFLPRARTNEQARKLCPAVVVRPEMVTDEREQSKVSIVIYVTVYDDDLVHGADSLFQVLEFVRAQLLMLQPIRNRYWIAGGIKTTILDDMPYPQWIGLMEFDVFVPHPRAENPTLDKYTSRWQKK